MQSRDDCCVFETRLMKDTKNGHKRFDDFFKFAKALCNEGWPSCKFGIKFLPMDVSSPQDLKSIWACSLKGGAAKQSTCFCHCCNRRSDQLTEYEVDDSRCSDCVASNDVKCFHWPITDSKHIELSSLKLIEHC